VKFRRVIFEMRAARHTDTQLIFYFIITF